MLVINSKGKVVFNEFIGDVGLLIYLYFSRAFDTIPHRRLCKRLKKLGIGGKLLEWVEDFLFESI